nr:salicylaldehyde dehydrogenase [Quercus suber]
MTPSIMPYVKDSEGRDVVPIFLDGKPISISSNSRLEPVTSFSSGKTPHYFMSATVDSCHEACESAWTAFSGTVLDTAGGSGWKRASAVTRRDIILKAADLFEARRQELIDAQILETSCSAVWAQNNIATSVGYMREIASCVSQIHGTIPTINKPDTFAFVFKEPVGPVLIIPPWNAALVLATRALTSAIGAGCSVVLKASELCPLTHSLIVAIYHDAGLPAGVLNSLQCRREDAGEITETLIKNERIRKVEFIGSAAVGRIIGSVAAKYLKPVLMELGMAELFFPLATTEG